MSLPVRKSPRLRSFDYASENYYFVTICTRDKRCLFGNGAERSRPLPTLSTVVGLYKSGASRLAGRPLWQKSFYDHIIRNEESYLEIWRYIDENPLKWREDELYTL